MSINVPLKWLDHVDEEELGVNWGVPWKRGELLEVEKLALCNGTGRSVPMSSWVTARWPDKSIKWTAHGAVLNGKETYSITAAAAPPVSEGGIAVSEDEKGISISTSRLSCRIPKSGTLFIEDLKKTGKKRGMNGTVNCKVQYTGTEGEAGKETKVLEN